jgi:hypothetical protein
MDLWKVLPDELQHEQLVKVRIQQRPHNRIQLPVMVVRALGKVHIHLGSLMLKPTNRRLYGLTKAPFGTPLKNK